MSCEVVNFQLNLSYKPGKGKTMPFDIDFPCFIKEKGDRGRSKSGLKGETEFEVELGRRPIASQVRVMRDSWNERPGDRAAGYPPQNGQPNYPPPNHSMHPGYSPGMTEDIFDDFQPSSQGRPQQGPIYHHPGQQPQVQPQQYQPQPQQPPPFMAQQPPPQQQPHLHQQQPAYPRVQPAQGIPNHQTVPLQTLPQSVPSNYGGLIQPQLQQAPPQYPQPQPGIPRAQLRQPGANFASPFSLDEEDDDDWDDSDDIDHLASEAERALGALRAAREKAEKGGLLERAIEMESHRDEPESAEQPDDENEPVLTDRIPAEAVIDPDLSLFQRIRTLANILKTHVEMTEMIVIDQQGFSLFETGEKGVVGKSACKYVAAMKKVYQSNERDHEASQLKIGEDRWLCLIPSANEDGRGEFLLKALLKNPLDLPEVYSVVDLFHEVLHPETD